MPIANKAYAKKITHFMMENQRSNIAGSSRQLEYDRDIDTPSPTMTPTAVETTATVPIHSNVANMLRQNASVGVVGTAPHASWHLAMAASR